MTLQPRLLLTLVSMLIFNGCSDGENRFAALDLELRAAAERDDFSGVVLVARAGDVELLQAYGHVEIDTCFNLASASKLFTLVGIAQLAHQGVLRLDDTVDKYLPAYPDPVFRANATIEQLIDHSSGLPDATGPEFFAAVDSAPSLEALLTAVAVPAESAPGAAVRYSNLGYLLLGRILELASLEGYDAYVARHILSVAGMQHTGPATSQSAGCATPMTRGPGIVTPRTPRRAFAPPRGTPAGSWYSTAPDLLRFFHALHEGRLVAAELASIKLPVRSWDPQRAVGHNGGGPGMNAALWLYPDLHQTVVVLSNYDPPAATQVADDIGGLTTGIRPPAGPSGQPPDARGPPRVGDLVGP
jgi:D-alanyl-D-alanine carboxypeptidase